MPSTLALLRRERANTDQPIFAQSSRVPTLFIFYRTQTGFQIPTRYVLCSLDKKGPPFNEEQCEDEIKDFV